MTLLATAPALPTSGPGTVAIQAVRRYRRLGALIPRTAVHYAVRTDPHPQVLAALAAAGCSFTASSADQVRACLGAGTTPDHLLVSAVGRSREEIGAAADLGVRLFVVAGPEDVCNIALAASGSAVLYRRMTTTPDSTNRQAVITLRQAAASGLEAAGISCHVRATQGEPHAWRTPIAAAGRAFAALREEGLHPWVLDLGGGLPAPCQPGTPPLALYGAAIDRALRQTFGLARPRTLVTAGATLVG
jgi:ornithine decarboxylase